MPETALALYLTYLTGGQRIHPRRPVLRTGSARMRHAMARSPAPLPHRVVGQIEGGPPPPTHERSSF